MTLRVLDREHAPRRFSYVVAGPYGTGKSTLLGSMAETGPTLCIATLQREANSWKYSDLKVPTILITDSGWMPSAGKYEATAFPEYVKLLEQLIDDDQYDNVVVDSGTELGEFAWHAGLATQGKYESPSDFPDDRSRWLPYESLDNKLDQGIKALVALTDATVAKRPKYIGISWHTQPPKEDTIVRGESKKSADQKGEGVEYEGTVLPMVRGKFRRKLGTLVDAVIFTDVQTRVDTAALSTKDRGFQTTYRLQVRPDHERHTKLPGPLPTVTHIPNSFVALRQLVEAGLAAEPPVEPAPRPAGSLRRR